MEWGYIMKFICLHTNFDKRLVNIKIVSIGKRTCCKRSWCSCFSLWSSSLLTQGTCAVQWCIYTPHWAAALVQHTDTIFTNVWHVKAERLDRWTPRLFGRPPSLNPPRAVDPMWPRGLYSGTARLWSRTGLPFITHGRLNHVHNLFISIIIRHHPAHGLRGFKNICLELSTRRTAVAGELRGLYIWWG